MQPLKLYFIYTFMRNMVDILYNIFLWLSSLQREMGSQCYLQGLI